MNDTRILQYTHRPNLTELGKGNTHETYMLISSGFDLSALFPPSIEVKVKDIRTGKIYNLKSTSGSEFRVNQMGELYRDYNVYPGDEVIFTKIERADSCDFFVNVKQYQRVVLVSNSKDVELINIERLDKYITEDQKYKLNIFDKNIQKDLVISFNETRRKRKDSPNVTNFYLVKIGDEILPSGTYYLTLEENTEITQVPKTEYNIVNVENQLLNSLSPINIIKKTNIDKIFNSYLAAIRTKPFILLAGISGTGKSRIVRKLAQASVTEELQKKYDTISVGNGFNRWEINKPANFEMIQVKPNWHNSMELVGYKSNINGEHYEFTPFVDFIVKAWMHQDVPFFLCLDEMNLAPVEQYFAEFLSAIESRSIENDEYITDPIIKPFDSFGSAVAGVMIGRFNSMGYNLPTTIENHFRTKGLTLPKNLIVMGTVNMDETTFTFSRKVLDRAMSIEMNEVDYDNFFAGLTEDDIPELSDDIKSALIDRPIKGLKAPYNEAGKVKAYLEAIDSVLQGTPFQLGYRAINEALLYVSASRIFGCENTNEALDKFTLMKILSRLEGDKRSLVTADNRELLPALMTVITSEQYPNSFKKLNGMIKTLNHKQFVSYWT